MLEDESEKLDPEALAAIEQLPLFRRSRPRPLDMSLRRLVDLLAGVFFPGLLLLYSSFSGFFVPEWQTGLWLDFGLMILNGMSLAAFAPLLIYSAFSLACVIAAPGLFAPYRVVRFGVYSGMMTIGPIAVLVGLWIVSNSAQTTLGPLVALLVALNMACFVWLLSGPLRRPWGRALLLLASFVLLLELLVVAVASGGIGGDLLFVMPIVQTFVLLCSLPWVSTVVFARYGWSLHARYGHSWQLRLIDLLGITTWAAGYMAAWRLAYHEALEHYSRLPSSPPTCYIATAAAHGHRRFVGAQERLAEDGTPRMVNQQFARLKAAELALLVLSPKLHRAVRAVYDRLGPPIARRLANRWLADAAYLSLKPAEWCATWILRRGVPDIDARAARLFD